MTAEMQHEPVPSVLPAASTAALTLQVVEVLHFCLDVDTAVNYYRDCLGWPVIWHSPGNMATIDAGGVYRLTLVAARWSEGWTAGQPVPGPQLALESKDLLVDIELLRANGLPELELGGDPQSMLCLDIPGPEGVKLFTWQDTVEGSAAKVLREYYAAPTAPALYLLGECVLFFNDVGAAESYFVSKLSFQIQGRHGQAYTNMRIAGGPVVGLYHWPKWWESPSEQAPQAPVRLFLECADIQAEHARQLGLGAAPEELQATPGGISWFNTHDPDGNALTFWQDSSG